mmetsp:Transcript_2782/g.8441  ORF Transcript_2782/g.8441 Transcript_2782/m.8441 type:complete len:903 (-) Transcript_2782:3625-6333(-)
MRRSLLVFAGLLAVCAHVLADTQPMGVDVEAAKGINLDSPQMGGMVDGEQHEFKAETSRLMDIIVHSLYSNREIFLRELVSNAADASDKYRMLKLAEDGTVLDDLDIRISYNKTDKTISVSDRGIGMTKDELIKNLGTIAKSGTSSFLEKYKDAKDEATLIGQFGVGFYSSFLVANQVSVASKHDDDTAHVWSSTADGSFTISEISDENFGRGTTVTLHLRDDADEFLEFSKLKELLTKYSAYIEFPIYLEEIKEKHVEVDPVTGETKSEEESDEIKEDEDEDEDEEDSDADKPDDDQEPEKDGDIEEDDDKIEVEEDGADKDGADDGKNEPKLEKVEVSEWKHINDQKPLWRRDPGNITDDEYMKFYDSIKKSPGDPISSSHFRAEGEVEFRALLYIPDRPPYDLYDANEQSAKESIRLYVRRVLLKGHFEEGLLPRYLGFIVGIVDSDDLPINISRETLQESKALELIRKKLVRKTLEMFKTLLKDEEKEREEADKKEEASESADTEEKKQDKKAKKVETRFLKFWKKYGVSLKLGAMEDRSNQKRLIQLLRFRSTATNLDDENDFVSFDEYVERMKEGQEYIYYLTGTSLEAVKSSPFLERLADKGYEVLFLADPIDEYWTQAYTDHDGVKLMSLSKDNFAFSDKDEKIAKKQMEEARKGVKPLSQLIKTVLGDKIERVKLSNRLRSVPMMVSSERTGYTANMELVARAQSFSDPTQLAELKSRSPKKVVELNPYHPLVKRLAEMVNSNESSDECEKLVRVMYDTALVASGFHIFDSTEYADRMARLVADLLEVDYDVMKEDLKKTSAEDTKLAAEDVKKAEEEAARKEAEEKAAAEEKTDTEGEANLQENVESDELGFHKVDDNIKEMDEGMMEMMRQAQAEAADQAGSKGADEKEDL